MAINETIVTGRKFRKCIDAVNKTWQRISFWTQSSDVEFADGKNAETKLGAIDGITDSLVDTSSRIAASAKAVSTLNNNLAIKLPNDVRVITEGSGASTKYYVQLGADTASKKLLGNNGGKKLRSFTVTAQANGSGGIKVGNSMTVKCNYDSEGNFTGLSNINMTWQSNVEQGYGAGNCRISGTVIN